jgi:hypothetical protein
LLQLTQAVGAQFRLAEAITPIRAAQEHLPEIGSIVRAVVDHQNVARVWLFILLKSVRLGKTAFFKRLFSANTSPWLSGWKC